MAASGGSERRPRRGPAPIASFDHDASEESSPETKQTFRLPEIREDVGAGLAPPEQRGRSLSSPAVGLQAPPAPRIDISRASSSSHHDSRDSSPELALFAGAGSGEESRTKLELGFREDGALDLRSSTEELAFLENLPPNGETRAPVTAPPSRRHSRKDSQGSETALLAVSGRTSRLSSVGSQCSAHSALSGFSHTSHVSRLSVVSGMSRSPSPHKMLLETSFCGPKPIETDPEICAAAVEERLLEIAKLSTEPKSPAAPIDARDRREVRTEVTLESSSVRAITLTRAVSNAQELTQKPVSVPVPLLASSTVSAEAIPAAKHPPITVPADEEKRLKETQNRARVEERKSRSKESRQKPEAEVYKTTNRSKDIIRIRLKPDDEYDDDDQESDRTLISVEPVRKPATLELSDKSALPSRTSDCAPQATPRRRDSRTPSPSGVPVSRKSSFCSLFKSKETIASPDSPDALKRKKSLNEGRSRSKSRDRSVTPTSTGKIKGSVLSLFKTPRKTTTSPSASSRDCSPVVQSQRQFPQVPTDQQRGEKLKYYEESKEGIIHIPLHTPPDELDRVSDKADSKTQEVARPSSAPQVSSISVTPVSSSSSTKPTQRTVLPDGSIIIPLHSPTEKISNSSISPELPKTVHSNAIVKEDQILRETKVIHDNSTIAQKHFPDDSSAPVDAVKAKRRERLTFTTHVGSREQVFSTQFSITKTPSITSEISGSIPSFPESDEIRIAQTEREVITPANDKNDTNFARDDADRGEDETNGGADTLEFVSESIGGSGPGTPQDLGRDSSESETGSDAVTRGGSDAERRGLVVQESFEELPYVPTTLPQERSLAVPIVPVRERGGVSVAGVRRPRASRASCSPPSAPLPPAPSAPLTPAAPPPPAPSAPRLHIRLPRRPRAASTSAAPPRIERPRTRSGSEAGASRREEWIDFSEVPERRKQPKRIQTLPAEAREAVSFAPPERCRCECHAHPPPLPAHAQLFTLESGSAAEERGEAAPFTADLGLRNHDDAMGLH